MPRKDFSIADLDRLKPEKGRKQTTYFDKRKKSGLGMRVSYGGTRTMFVHYHFNPTKEARKGKTEYYNLGHWPDDLRRQLEAEWKGDPADINSTEIRKYAEREAANIRVKARQHIDPKEDEKRLEQEDKRAKKHSVQSVAMKFVEEYAKPTNRSWRETARYIGLRPDPENPDKLKTREGGFVEKFSDQPISSITKADIRHELLELKKRGSGYASNGALAAYRRMFNWAVETDHLENSPIKGLKPLHKKQDRDRVLSDNEVRSLWLAWDQKMEWPWAPYFKILLLTAQRRGEVATMRWRDLDLDSENPVWIIPAEMSKADRVHEVPLVPEVIEILRACDTDNKPTGEYIFTTAGSRPVSAFGTAKATTDKHVAEMAANEECKPIEENWRIHDLRRTAATGMAKLNTPLHVLASILNHSPGAAMGIGAIYNRYEYGNEKRMALEAWARQVHALVEKREDNIIPLHG